MTALPQPLPAPRSCPADSRGQAVDSVTLRGWSEGSVSPGLVQVSQHSVNFHVTVKPPLYRVVRKSSGDTEAWGVPKTHGSWPGAARAPRRRTEDTCPSPQERPHAQESQMEGSRGGLGGHRLSGTAGRRACVLGTDRSSWNLLGCLLADALVPDLTRLSG